MTADLNLFGIFLNGGLFAALVAGVLVVIVRRVLDRWNLYRFFWHPALLDVALFVLLWGGVSFEFQNSPQLTAALLG